jgi:hypothetical protein
MLSVIELAPSPRLHSSASAFLASLHLVHLRIPASLWFPRSSRCHPLVSPINHGPLHCRDSSSLLAFPTSTAVSSNPTPSLSKLLPLSLSTLPRRAEAAPPPCAAELAAVLACFAATSDLRAQGEGTSGCASAARQLHACMKKGGGSGKKQSSSVSVPWGWSVGEKQHRGATPPSPQLPTVFRAQLTPDQLPPLPRQVTRHDTLVSLYTMHSISRLPAVTEDSAARAQLLIVPARSLDFHRKAATASTKGDNSLSLRFRPGNSNPQFLRETGRM